MILVENEVTATAISKAILRDGAAAVEVREEVVRVCIESYPHLCCHGASDIKGGWLAEVYKTTAVEGAGFAIKTINTCSSSNSSGIISASSIFDIRGAGGGFVQVPEGDGGAIDLRSTDGNL